MFMSYEKSDSRALSPIRFGITREATWVLLSSSLSVVLNGGRTKSAHSKGRVKSRARPATSLVEKVWF